MSKTDRPCACTVACLGANACDSQRRTRLKMKTTPKGSFPLRSLEQDTTFARSSRTVRTWRRRSRVRPCARTTPWSWTRASSWAGRPGSICRRTQGRPPCSPSTRAPPAASHRVRPERSLTECSPFVSYASILSMGMTGSTLHANLGSHADTSGFVRQAVQKQQQQQDQQTQACNTTTAFALSHTHYHHLSR